MNNIYKNQEEYLNEFLTPEYGNESKKIEEALKMALDIRKFEIDLYWKRATYFWTFIGAAFAGYFLLVSNTVHPEEKIPILIVSVLGFLFSFSWYLVNKGSKFWQNNWERHVDYLEDKVMGPLYKIVTNPKKNNFLNPITEYPLSVSKINQLLSFIVTLIWTVLIYLSLDMFLNKWWLSLLIEVSIGINLIALYFFFCKSDLSDKSTTKEELKEAVFIKRTIK